MRKKENRAALARRLREARFKAKISQVEVAAALGFSSPQFVSNLERGESPLPAKHIKTLSKMLNIEVSELKNLVMKDFEERLDKEIG